MVAWPRRKWKGRLVWVLSASALSVASFVVLLSVSMNEVRKQKAEFILSILGSRNTSQLVNPLVDTVLVDGMAGWLSQRALDRYQGLEKLVLEKYLVVRDLQTKPQVSAPPFVLIVVMSEFSCQANRDAIRKTWYTWASMMDSKVVFFLGLPSNNDTLAMGEIDEEIRTHHDLIVDEHVESYYLLPVKVLRVLKWFNSTYPHEASRPSFLVKTDHDVFNHIPNLVRHLRSAAHISNYIGGQLNANSPLIRDGYSKWYTPTELWSESNFPDYLGGHCYILAGNVVPLIYEAALSEKLFHLEDVFITGIVRSKHLKIPAYEVPNDQMPQNEYKMIKYDRNVENFLAFHPVSPEKMHEYFGRFRRSIAKFSQR